MKDCTSTNHKAMGYALSKQSLLSNDTWEEQRGRIYMLDHCEFTHTRRKASWAPLNFRYVVLWKNFLRYNLPKLAKQINTGERQPNSVEIRLCWVGPLMLPQTQEKNHLVGWSSDVHHIAFFFTSSREENLALSVTPCINTRPNMITRSF